MTQILMWLVPSVAHACPVCAANQTDQGTYLVPTAILLALPLLLVGGLVFWLKLRSRP